MALVKKIISKFNGLHYQQEYICLSREALNEPSHLYLVSNNQIIKNITNHHLFVGYCPLILAFTTFTDVVVTESIQLILSQHSLSPNGFFSKKDALATLTLKQIKKQVAGNNTVFYFEGTHGSHHFLSQFHQLVNDTINQWYNKKPGNVFLHSNLYKQVQIAYAIPRIISLITVGNRGLFNLFPTDLHGQADDEHYIISLRIGGKACEQVEATGKLAIAQVDCNAYKTVYALGKNHMQELKSRDNFPFGQSLSAQFQLPLPQAMLSYKELALQDTFACGIHKILLFKIVTNQQAMDQTATLAHIHNSYATWRYKNKLPGNYLLR